MLRMACRACSSQQAFGDWIGVVLLALVWYGHPPETGMARQGFSVVLDIEEPITAVKIEPKPDQTVWKGTCKTLDLTIGTDGQRTARISLFEDGSVELLIDTERYILANLNHTKDGDKDAAKLVNLTQPEKPDNLHP